MRLFVALWPQPAQRAALERLQQAWAWPADARPVPAARLHLTLHFIGEWPDARVGALADALAQPGEPFALRLGSHALWLHGVAVCLPLETPAALAGLHGRTQKALEAQGVRVERRAFHPHVTLARHAVGARAPAATPMAHWGVRGYALVQSVTGPQGGYRVLRRYPLQQAASPRP